MCTPQWCYIHFSIDLSFITPLHHALSVSSQCPSKIWLSSGAVKMYRCTLQLPTRNINFKDLHTHSPPPLKIMLRTYHPLILQNKLNTEWRRHWQVLFLQRFFFYSVHCLCYLSKKLENTISFPHSSFLFHLENIDFAPPCDSYAAQVNMALFNICPSLGSAIKFTVALGEKPGTLLASSFATKQTTTILACAERLLVWLICLCMLYSSKHMTGHQELINSDVSFNNTQL